MQIADKLLTVFDHFWGWQITELNNRSWATQAVALNTSKAFDKVWRVVLLHILTSYGISDQIFGLILSFLSNRWLRVALDGKTLLKFLIGLFLALKFSHYKLITLLMMLSVILLSMLMILSILSMIRHLICNNN